jgi:hypothetical protein
MWYLVILAIVALASQILVSNEEIVIALCFVSFVSFTYPMISSAMQASFEQRKQEILQQLIAQNTSDGVMNISAEKDLQLNSASQNPNSHLLISQNWFVMKLDRIWQKLQSTVKAYMPFWQAQTDLQGVVGILNHSSMRNWHLIALTKMLPGKGTEGLSLPSLSVSPAKASLTKVSGSRKSKKTSF